MRNKANSRRRVGRGQRDEGQLCETNPIPRLRIGNGPAAGCPPCSLPPRACAGRLYKRSQSRQRVKRVKCLPGKELWLIVHSMDLGKTKPIPGYAGWDVAMGGEYAKQTQFAAPPRETKPAGRGAIVRHRLDAPLRETKPNLGKMGHLGDGAPERGMSCETKPIRPGGAGRDGAWGTWGVGQMRQTNPIGPGRDRAGSPTAKDAKQSQFRQRVETVKCLVGNKANCPKRGTEAVSRDRAEAMDVESATDAQRRCGHRMPATPASGMTTGIGFTGGGGRVILGIRPVYGV
jgi:hypothetical protein